LYRSDDRSYDTVGKDLGIVPESVAAVVLQPDTHHGRRDRPRFNARRGRDRSARYLQDHHLKALIADAQ
jgi:hypothetical protein